MWAWPLPSDEEAWRKRSKNFSMRKLLLAFTGESVGAAGSESTHGAMIIRTKLCSADTVRVTKVCSCP